MLTLFRRIRKSLLSSGSVKKYTLYAIGEIALVVIGILIALQINNWNQSRLDRIEEQKILVAISKDVNRIKYWCDLCASSSQAVLKGSTQLLNVVHSDDQDYPEVQREQDLARIFERCLVGTGLAENIYDVLKSSDQLELITSRELRNELSNLDSQLGTMIAFERLQNDFMDNQLKPLVNQFIDRTQLNYKMVGYEIAIDTSEFDKRFKSDYQGLNEQREFSNLLVDFMIHTNEIIDLYRLIHESTGIIDSLLYEELPPINMESK